MDEKVKATRDDPQGAPVKKTADGLRTPQPGDYFLPAVGALKSSKLARELAQTPMISVVSSSARPRRRFLQGPGLSKPGECQTSRPNVQGETSQLKVIEYKVRSRIEWVGLNLQKDHLRSNARGRRLWDDLITGNGGRNTTENRAVAGFDLWRYAQVLRRSLTLQTSPPHAPYGRT